MSVTGSQSDGKSQDFTETDNESEESLGVSPELKLLAQGEITDFFDFKDWEECSAFAYEYLNIRYTHGTYFGTNFYSSPSMYGYNKEMIDATTAVKKSAVVAKYLREVLSSAAPLTIGIWFLDKKVLTKCYTEISKVEYKTMIDLFKASGKVKQTRKEDLETYQTCSKMFRDACKDVLPKDVFGCGDCQLPTDIPIHPSQISSLIDFYNGLVEKRTFKIQEQRDERKLMAQRYKEFNKKDTFTVGHYPEFYDFLCLREHTGSIDLSQRTRSGTGNMSFAIGPSPGTQEDRSTKTGYLLLSTALEQHIRLTKTDLAFYSGKNLDDAHWKTAIAEVQDMYDKQKEINENRLKVEAEQAYFQQCANMDIVFNFFLQSYAIGYKAPDASLKNLNTFLNIMGQKFLGKEKVSARVNKSKFKIKNIAQYFNTTKSIHMPPYAITEHRLYDWIAVFGMVRFGTVELMNACPGISTRYFTHFRLDNCQALAAVLSFAQLEFNADPKSEVKESEHMFHQMLLGKYSAYESSVGLRGNAFNVNFVTAEEV